MNRVYKAEMHFHSDQDLGVADFGVFLVSLARLHASYRLAMGQSRQAIQRNFFFLATIQHDEFNKFIRVQRISYGSPGSILFTITSTSAGAFAFIWLCMQIANFLRQHGVVDQDYISDVLGQTRDILFHDLNADLYGEFLPRVISILERLRNPNMGEVWIQLSEENEPEVQAEWRRLRVRLLQVLPESDNQTEPSPSQDD